jgi:hypothetical protein
MWVTDRKEVTGIFSKEINKICNEGSYIPIFQKLRLVQIQFGNYCSSVIPNQHNNVVIFMINGYR